MANKGQLTDHVTVLDKHYMRTKDPATLKMIYDDYSRIAALIEDDIREALRRKPKQPKTHVKAEA